MSESESQDGETETGAPEEWRVQIKRHEVALQNIAESNSPDAHIARAMLKWADDDNPTVKDLQRLVAQKKSNEVFQMVRTAGVFSFETRVEKLLRRISE